MKRTKTAFWAFGCLLALMACGPRVERFKDAQGRVVREIRQQKGHWLITTFYPDGRVRNTTDRHETGETVVFFDEEGNRIGEDVKKNGSPILVTMTRWYPNGQKRSVSEYRDGQRFGTWREWYPSGQVRSEMGYQADRYEGVRNEYSEQGVRVLEGYYHQGLEEGVWIYRDAQGSVATRIPFRGGKREGAEEQYYPGGGLKLRARYREGKASGLWEEWFENGKPSLKADYVQGEPDGVWQEWFPDGSPDFRLEYRKGRPWSGNRILYREDGSPEKEEVWRQGHLLHSRTFPSSQGK